MLLSRLAGVGDAAAASWILGRRDRYAWIADVVCDLVRDRLAGCGWTVRPGEDPRRTMVHAGAKLLEAKQRPRWAAICWTLRRWFDQQGFGVDGGADSRVAGAGAHVLACLATSRHDDEGRLLGRVFGVGWLERAAAAWDDHDESFMLDNARDAVRRLWADSPLYPMAIAREAACVLVPLAKETFQ